MQVPEQPMRILPPRTCSREADDGPKPAREAD